MWSDSYGSWRENALRRTFRFVPTSSSWLNVVGGYVAKRPRCGLKHGVFRSVSDLETANTGFIGTHNLSEAKSQPEERMSAPFATLTGGAPPVATPCR